MKCDHQTCRTNISCVYQMLASDIPVAVAQPSSSSAAAAATIVV